MLKFYLENVSKNRWGENMEFKRFLQSLKKDVPCQKTVSAHECCPAYAERDGAMPCERECWFCVYADFHLEQNETLEKGICHYPQKNKKVKQSLQSIR